MLKQHIYRRRRARTFPRPKAARADHGEPTPDPTTRRQLARLPEMEHALPIQHVPALKR